MRSRFRRTGVSGSRRIVPFRVTRPPRMSSPALEREQKPSLDNARARPVLLFAPGKAFSARSFDCLWVLCLGVRTLQIAPLPGSLFYADGTVSSNKKNYIAVLKKERFGRKVRAGVSRRRRNDASQPYRFGSRSVPRRPSPFDFAELVSPHPHTLKGKPPHPYIESCNRFSLLVYDPRSLCDPALAPILAGPGTLFG